MEDSIERKRLAILKILSKVNKPISSQLITGELKENGYDISESTVRFHLLSMDKSGLTTLKTKYGRQITELGRKKLTETGTFKRVGFLNAKINQSCYEMDFDFRTRKGRVIINISLLKKEQLLEAVPLMLRVFNAKISMGNLLAFFDSGTQAGEMMIPEGYVGIATVCSVTLNAILLKNGIPCNSIFGGLLDYTNGTPTRFSAIIKYDSTTIDPLEIFIKSGMTDYLGVTSTGNGRIGAGFREIPAVCRSELVKIAEELKRSGLAGFLEIGFPDQPLYEIPVNSGNIGLIVIGGLNPIAILEESGMSLQSRALSGFIEYSDLFPCDQMMEKAKKMLG